MIILLGSQKGGCGKSTIAINIACSLANLGKDVVLVGCWSTAKLRKLGEIGMKTGLSEGALVSNDTVISKHA